MITQADMSYGTITVAIMEDMYIHGQTAEGRKSVKVTAELYNRLEGSCDVAFVGLEAIWLDCLENVHTN
jgi:hypothetical protein